MKTVSFIGSQQFKRWVLLLVTLIALIIWIRNLSILIPSGEINMPDTESRTRRPLPDDSLLIVTATSFHESEEWQDPFIATFLKLRKNPTGHTKKDITNLPKKRDPLPPPPWNLAGLVWTVKLPAAVLSSADGQVRLVVTEGDTLDGYQVVSIDKTSVKLRRGQQTWEVTIDEHADASTP